MQWLPDGLRIKKPGTKVPGFLNYSPPLTLPPPLLSLRLRLLSPPLLRCEEPDEERSTRCGADC